MTKNSAKMGKLLLFTFFTHFVPFKKIWTRNQQEKMPIKMRQTTKFMTIILASTAFGWTMLDAKSILFILLF